MTEKTLNPKNETQGDLLTRRLEKDIVAKFVPSVWEDGSEEFWFRRLWDILEKQGLTSYRTPEEKNRIIIRAAALEMIYLDLCEKIIEELASYDYMYEKVEEEMEDRDSLRSLYIHSIGNEEYPYDAEQATYELTDRERPIILDAVRKEMDDAMICVSAYCTLTYSWNLMFEDDEEDDDDVYRIPGKIYDYDEFWKAVAENLQDIADERLMECGPGYEWLVEGGYRLH